MALDLFQRQPEITTCRIRMSSARGRQEKTLEVVDGIASTLDLPRNSFVVPSAVCRLKKQRFHPVVAESPSEKDWGNRQSDLDEVTAHQRFFGKSIAEIEQQFATDPMAVLSGFRFMPPIPFRYFLNKAAPMIELPAR
jgi:hypothetical protein